MISPQRTFEKFVTLDKGSSSRFHTLGMLPPTADALTFKTRKKIRSYFLET